MHGISNNGVAEEEEEKMYDKPEIVEVFPSIEAVRGNGHPPLTKTGGFADVFIAGQPLNVSVPAYEGDE